MSQEIVTWFVELPPSLASILGTLIGSLFGILALLIGALFNSYLNRRRDERLREKEKTGLKYALSAELLFAHEILRTNADDLEKNTNIGGDILVPDVSQFIKIFPKTIEKLMVLETSAISDLLSAHANLAEYPGKLQIAGGTIDHAYGGGDRIIKIPQTLALYVASINRSTLPSIMKAVKSLE